MSVSTKPSYVLKDNYLQVTVKGKPFSLDSSHPTFERLKNALKKKRWKEVPKLVSIAQTVLNDTHGHVELKKGVVFYKGREIHSTLTERMLDMINKGKSVKHLVMFMDNLYLNPSEKAVRSFYDWLVGNDLPITDSGEFLAYKSVKHNNKDTHTNTIDNSPGQIIMMSRRVADSDYDHQCSTGFHICSKQYGVYGDKTMAVKVNPKDVLSAVGGKMRVTKYEVLKELGSKEDSLFRSEGFSGLEKQLVVEISKERKELVKMLLSASAIKKAIKGRKLKRASIEKASYARLKTMAQKYYKVPSIGPEDTFFLQKARKAAGLTVGQLAKEMGVSYKVVANLEKDGSPLQSKIDKYLEAVASLTGNRNLARSAVTYPKAVATAA